MRNYGELEEPLITVGIPVKNRAFCIRDVLMAIEALEYPRERVKLIFVDDYSTDGTFEILKEWKDKLEKPYFEIVLIQEHTNIPKARNLCIKNMDGNFLLFWDSDVIPQKKLLKKMLSALESNDSIGIIGADYYYEHSNKLTKMLGKPVTDRATNAVYMGFTLIRREVFNRIGGFNESLDVGEDTEFGMRLVEKTDYRIMWSPTPVLHLRMSTDEEREHERLLSWLSYNFRVRGEQYAQSFRDLPLFLRFRIFYYALLPPALVLTLFLAYMGLPWMLFLLIIYLLPGLVYSNRNLGIRKGTVSFLTFNIPTGIALSYGVLKALARVS